jgi:hypothetical protein
VGFIRTLWWGAGSGRWGYWRSIVLVGGSRVPFWKDRWELAMAEGAGKGHRVLTATETVRSVMMGGTAAAANGSVR